MQNELNQAVDLGFRVVSGASAEYDEVAYLLERSEDPFLRGYYLLLATRRLSTMEEELNASAAQGYRLHPDSILYNDCELVLLMQPLAPEDGRYQYRVLGTDRTSTMQRELEQAYQEGFRLVDLVSADDNIAVLERDFRP
ncbi:MAG TPA: hypothetical protein VLU25_07640 [Acidobacteriota bacterium]|nr:hypothetical protein [Acidobacteriota bacterium]